jgi:photosystem II stability/assembly factor-like uncharacterized protein
MKKMKKLYYILIMILLSQFSYAQYWKEITNIPSPYNTNYWLDVSFLQSDANYGWVCGFNGMVIRTTDGGSTWRGSIAPDANHLESVVFPTKLIGYTSGVEGIYKSTDGGATWSDVTPDKFGAEYWGNYFIDANNGIVVGGGCVSSQKFWKTTDGGATWTSFLANEPNSGLTDVYISSPTGLGYAVSSGVLWQTTNGGATWTIKSYAGSKVWLEELTFFNNSFLFPYAGFTCSGQGNTGGMRFTTNGGLSWNEYTTGSSMFGAFLLGDKEGWVCGNEKITAYTDDGGLTWVNKNCGLGEGDYDDIWFNNKNDGWVVGSGVYHLQKAEFPVSKDSLVFRTTCEKNKSIDTVWITNNSFETSEVDISLSGNGNNTLKIISPAITNFTMAPCSKVAVVIMFSPVDTNEIREFLNIKFNQYTVNEKIYSLPIIAKAVSSTIYPETDIIVVNSVRVGVPFIQTLTWFAKLSGENIIFLQNLTYNDDFSVKTKLPLSIMKNGTVMEFTILLQDTGWIETKFVFKSDKCNKDTIITIRAYGRSPIIKSSGATDMQIICDKMKIDSVEIKNSGNDTLNIDNIIISPLTPYFKFLGFTDLSKTPAKIPQGKSKFALIEFTPDTTGKYSSDLIVTNNDSTKKEGIKNPFIIKLKGNFDRPLFTEKQFIDFGNVCIYEKMIQTINFENFGNADANIIISHNVKNPFIFKFDQSSPPYLVKGKSKITGSISFTPLNTGNFTDTLIIKFTPCNDSMIVIVKGTGISNILEISPLLLNGVVRVGDSLSFKITVKSKSSLDINITKISLADNNSNWDFSHDAKLPLLLLSGQTTTFNTKFISLSEGVLKTQIIIETESLCNENYSVEVDLSSYEKFIQVTPDNFDFGFVKCTPEKRTTFVNIMNHGFKTDTISRIEFENPDNIFSIKNCPAIPFYIAKEDTFKLEIEFHPPSEGTFTNNLTVESFGHSFKIPVEASFKKSNTISSANLIDFGNIEECESGIEIPLDLINSGMLDDTLEISITGNNVSFYTLPDSVIAVPSNSTAKLYIGDIPKKLFLGWNYAKILLKSKICENEIIIDVKANSVKAKLDYNPKSIDLGDIWMESQRDTSFVVRNISVVPVNIIKITSSNNDFAVNFTQPIILNPSSDLILSVKFKAKFEGSQNSEIQVFFETNCLDSISMNIKANVPKEIYYTKIYIEHHIASAGAEIVIPVKLNNGIEKFQSSKIDFQIDFDHRLFYPQEVSIKNGKNYSVSSFDYSFGKLMFTADKTLAPDLLKDSGSIALIKGYVLAAVPDSTPLIVTDFNLNTEKTVNIEKENGSLKAGDFCPETAKFELRFIPKFESEVNEVVDDGKLSIKLKSSEAMDIELYISDINGNTTPLGNIKANTSEQIYEFDLSRYSSGIYFLKVESQFRKKLYKFILNK